MNADHLNLAVQIAPGNKRGLLLRNPVMTASGTFGYGAEYAALTDIQGLGAIVCKGTTLEPRAGNPQPRLVETASGLLNSIGMENIGVRALIWDKAPLWAAWRVPVIVNVLGQSEAEYGELAALLDGVPGVRGIELNVSCPNVAAGGMEFGAAPETAAAVTRAAKRKTSLPVIVKLSPNVTDIVAIARAVEEAGADALTLTNTVRGMAIDVKTRRPVLGGINGGLSGPAIKPVALYLLYKVARAVKVPLIGCGGISSASDALEFIMGGASAVQVGTATFSDPGAALDMVAGIGRFMEEEGVKDIKDLVGAAG